MNLHYNISNDELTSYYTPNCDFPLTFHNNLKSNSFGLFI